MFVIIVKFNYIFFLDCFFMDKKKNSAKTNLNKHNVDGKFSRFQI